MKSARAGAERIWHSRNFKKWRNPVWISHFLNCTDGAKDPAFRRRRFHRSFLNSGAYQCVFWMVRRTAPSKQVQDVSVKAAHSQKTIDLSARPSPLWGNRGGCTQNSYAVCPFMDRGADGRHRNSPAERRKNLAPEQRKKSPESLGLQGFLRCSVHIILRLGAVI